MTQKHYKKIFKHIPALSYLILIFFLALTGCPSGNKNNTSSGSGKDGNEPAGVSAPAWTQTEYVFQNKTDGQISIRNHPWKAILNTNECVYIEHLSTSLDSAKFTKAGKGQLCGNSYGNCSDKLKASQDAGNYKNFKRDTNSKQPYMEVYNIVDSDHLFETVGTPFADSSQKNPWLARCTSPAKEDNKISEQK